MTGGLVESLVARIVMQRDLLEAMSEHCRSISVRVTCRDGSVSAQVDGSGALTGLWLGESAYRNGADGLATLIVATAQAAANMAFDRQCALLTEFTARMSELQEAPLVRRDGTTFEPASRQRDSARSSGHR